MTAVDLTGPIYRLAPEDRDGVLRQFVGRTVVVEANRYRDARDEPEVLVGEVLALATSWSGTTRRVLVIADRRRGAIALSTATVVTIRLATVGDLRPAGAPA